MATGKKGSKGRFLYLFDWNAKSRKKLFSNKYESSEGSNQGNESVDNLGISPYFLKELCENGDRSFRGSGNYRCASSVNGDDGYGTKAPGVVARLMGLDSIPTTSCEASSISSYEFQAVGNSYYPKEAASFQREHPNLDYGYAPNKMEGLPWSTMDSRRTKVHGRPIERFQTEILPPKSAKPISITHHKLLSPIKSPGFVSTKDATYIMEAAARIIDPSPHAANGVKIPSLGSPSSSFKLQDLKEKLDAAQRSSRLSQSSRTPKHSPSVLQLRENSYDRSSSRSLFRNIMDSESQSLQKVKNKGKSASVPVQSVTKTPKKEGLVYRDNKNQLQKEHKQDKLKQNQPSTQKFQQTRTSRGKKSDALRQNNGRQNNVSLKEKSTSKPSVYAQQPRKIAPGDNSVGPSKIVKKVLVNTENGPKKTVTSTNVIDKRASLHTIGEKRPTLNKIKNISRNKPFARRDDQLAENVSDGSDERTGQCSQPFQTDSRMGMDVISFTFTSPIKKSGAQSLSCTGDSRSNRFIDADTCHTNNQTLAKSLLSPASGSSLIDSGSLSFLLEQKLRELTDKIVASKSDAELKEGSDVDSVSCFSEPISSHGFVVSHYDERSDKDQTSNACDDDCASSLITKLSQNWEDFEGIEEHGISGITNHNAGRKSEIGHFNISIPECSISGSCMSSSTASEFTYGYDQPSSPQSQEVTSCMSTESVLHREDETGYNDVGFYWELEYVGHILHYTGLKRRGLEVDSKLIDPGVFELLENLISTSGKNEELCSKLERKILFDGVAEVVSSRHDRVFLGSHKEWAKWEMLLQNEWLSEDVYKEIFCLQSMGSLMVDELVDRDMSSHYGKWQNFEIESLEEGMDLEKDIVASLVDELVSDLSIYYTEAF